MRHFQTLLENINILEERELTLNNILLLEGFLNLQKIIKPEKITALSKQLQNKSNIKDMKKLNKLLNQAVPKNLSSSAKLKATYDKLYKKNNDFSSIYSLLSKNGLSKDQALVGAIVLFLSGTKLKIKKNISALQLSSLVIANGVKKIAANNVPLDKKVLITIGTKLMLDAFNNQKINISKNRSFKDEDRERGTEYASPGFFDFGKNMTSEFNPDIHLTTAAKEEYEKTAAKNRGELYSIKSNDVMRSPKYNEPKGQERHVEYGKYLKPMSTETRFKNAVDANARVQKLETAAKMGELTAAGKKELERARNDHHMWNQTLSWGY